jgi:hypothetical protein
VESEPGSEGKSETDGSALCGGSSVRDHVVLDKIKNLLIKRLTYIFEKI